VRLSWPACARWLNAPIAWCIAVKTPPATKRIAARSSDLGALLCDGIGDAARCRRSGLERAGDALALAYRIPQARGSADRPSSSRAVLRRTPSTSKTTARIGADAAPEGRRSPSWAAS
jgi:hypothetical protein